MSAHPELAALLRRSSKVLVFSGAGISTGSGIPDYRGPKGVWNTKRPVYYQDFMSSDAARREYWEQKCEAWEMFRDAQPNAVHHAVVALERAGKLVACVTQNIDGLHARAGTSAELLIELHGTASAVECQSCRARSAPEQHVLRFRVERAPPQCECGGWLKPATISFGQSLRSEDIRGAADAAHEADLVVALGSTLSVHPAASIPLIAAQRGAAYAIVNQGPTDHDALQVVTLRVEGDVVELFPAAVAAAIG